MSIKKNPLFFFLKCFFYKKRKEKYAQLAIHDLFHKFSYRYSLESSKDPLIVLKYFYRSLRLLFSSNIGTLGNNTSAIFDFSEKSQDSRIKYLDFNGQPKLPFILRNNLPNSISLKSKVINTLLLLILFFILQILSFFRKDKACLGVIQLELTELLLLSEALINQQVNELYIFCAYEKDIYFLSFYLNTVLDIKTLLIPSSNPISFYYQKVFCHTFIFTAPFQVYEYQKHKNNWKVESLKSWKPFGAEQIRTDRLKNIEPKTIGIFSSGMELRKHLGHNNTTGGKNYLAEMALLEFMRSFLLHNSEYKVLIFLHPLEKKSAANTDFAVNFYNDIFGPTIKYAPLHEPSNQNFDLCDIGLSSFSSSMIDRLYAGFKVIFTPFQHLTNYFGDDRLEAISGKSETELKKLILTISELSTEEYFEKYQLKDYRHDSYHTQILTDIK